jgi:hypothetical protein
MKTKLGKARRATRPLFLQKLTFYSAIACPLWANKRPAEGLVFSICNSLLWQNMRRRLVTGDALVTIPLGHQH